MKKCNFLKKLVLFLLLLLNISIFDSFCVVNGDSEYEDIVGRDGSHIPGRLIRAGIIKYTADDVVAFALKVTLKDIEYNPEAEEGKRYFITQEGKEKFQEAVEAYLSGAPFLKEFIEEMKNVVQNPNDINESVISKYVKYIPAIFPIEWINSLEGKNKIQEMIRFYNQYTNLFNSGQIDIDQYYNFMGINERSGFQYIFKGWNFNEIACNTNKARILYMVTRGI